MKPFRTRIKFCGITRLADAQAAVALGVDLLGFVLVPKSPRFIEAAAAEAIRRQLPPGVSSVALFKDASAAEIETALQVFRPDWLQFHGAETATEAETWGRPYLKAVAMKGGADLAAARAAHPAAAALLLDGHAPGAMGGSGERFDWAEVRHAPAVPIFIAGGLTPENVGEAIRIGQPYGVDVSGGIESAPGVKDSGKMRAFVAAVRAADTTHRSP
jgi:phosphoribosylanthranilate isomerase